MAKNSNLTDDYIVAIGANIRHFRQKRGYTLEALGNDIGLDKGNMHKIESGKNVTLLTLLKIALFLDVPAAKLLDTDMKMTSKDAVKIVARKKNTKPAGKKKSVKKVVKKKNAKKK